MSHRSRILPTLSAALATLLAAPAAAWDDGLRHELGLGLAASDGATLSASWLPTLPLLGGRLRLGVGARLSSFLGGSSVRFTDIDLPGARETLTVDRPRLFALNAMLGASVRLAGDLEAGFDIDLVGVGFGASVEGDYRGQASAGRERARPARLDLLLLGARDKGQLDSTFFLAWWPGRLGLRAGVSHEITEYVAQRALGGSNDRFRLTATRVFVAVGYRN